MAGDPRVQPDAAPRIRLSGMAPLGLILLCLALLTAAGFHSLQGVLRERAVDEAASILSGADATINSWLDRYRALPALYARDPRLAAAMRTDPDPGVFDRLSVELAAWNRIAGTSDTYVMAPDGTTVAASNWDRDLSFVGQNFSFRPYFTRAMQGQEGRFFGLGTTSGLRGYYFSAPIRSGDAVLGVIVVKISAAELETALSDSVHPFFVTDDSGVIALSGLADLRLSSLGPVGPDAGRIITETRRYDLSAIAPAPIAAAGDWGPGLPLVTAPSRDPAGGTRRYLTLQRTLHGDDWVLHLLYDVSAVRTQMRTVAAAVVAVGIAIAALAALGLQRRRRMMQRLADRERDRVVLERRVRARTAELTASNARLETEVAERRAAEDSLRQTQSELVQAGKLAALGQMSAALSHEFNQPLAAIRTYAENAAAFYEAGRAERVKDNLGRILRLTERMAQLSKHLTRFARRSGDDVVAVAIDQVIAEAAELLAGRIDRSGARIDLSGERGLTVMGGAVRLQHVVMNLVGNAIEAVPEGRAPVIGIALARRGGLVDIVVGDNGTGIAEDVLPKVFDPFFTTKEVGRGLGLGLSISYNIVRDFGGTMRAETLSGGGARFTVTLAAAPTANQVATGMAAE